MNNPRKWELLNPESVFQIEPMKINPHPSTLEAKTVLLRWNGKHNGDNFLNRVAEFLSERVQGIRIIKSWEFAPETAMSSQNPDTSKEFAKKLASQNPDLVIGAQGD